MNQQQLRKNVVELLSGGHAHIPPDVESLSVPRAFRAIRPPGMHHSAWELLEHMRTAQEDILRYTLDPNWVSPPYPEGYWPPNPSDIPDQQYSESISKFLADLEELIGLGNNKEIDLTAQFPHGEGRTYLRQLLLASDHNSYHLGQFIQVKKALGLQV